MSMDLGGAKGGVKSDINVTPLVDVMLVLLIIMMLVAPLLQQGISVKLPVATNTTDHPEVSGQTVVAIAPDEGIYLNAKPISKARPMARGSSHRGSGVFFFLAGPPTLRPVFTETLGVVGVTTDC